MPSVKKKVLGRIEAEKTTSTAKKANGTADKKRKIEKTNIAQIDTQPIDISDDDLLGYIAENRVGDAKLYCRLFRGKTIFVNKWERFLTWGGHHWCEDEYNCTFQNIATVCALYVRLADSIQSKADAEPDKIIQAKLQRQAEQIDRRVNQLRDIPGQDKLLMMVRRIQNPLILLPSQIDQKHYHKPCPNGVIDLRTGELRDGVPEDYLLNAIKTPYNPDLIKLDDPCPEATKFLTASMDGDTELVNFIWRLLGYGLITERRDHIFTIMWGEHGRNGKDTLINLVTHVLGTTLSGDVPVEMFLQMQQARSSSAPSPDVLALRGMCIAWINEAEENQRFASAKLKKLTGGGQISARGIQDKGATQWSQTQLSIMTTNEIPKAKADDAAFWHRAILIKWPLSFVDIPEQLYERPADKNLTEKLHAEAQGVLARMVQGAMEYLRDGLKVPEKVRQWTREQRAKWDDVGTFIEEWCEREKTVENPNLYQWRTPAGDLHNAFCVWYAQNKDKRFSVSAKKFAEALNKKDIPSKRSNGTWRLGIRLNILGLEGLAEAQSSTPKGKNYGL